MSDLFRTSVAPNGDAEPRAIAEPRSDDSVATHAPQSLDAARRLIFGLQARIAELEMEIRRRGYSDAVRDLEECAVLRDLDIRSEYLRYLEGAVGALNDHIVMVTNDRDAVVAHARQVAGSLDALQSSRSYRTFLRATELLRRMGPIYVVLRLVFRVAMKARRRLGQLLHRTAR